MDINKSKFAKKLNLQFFATPTQTETTTDKVNNEVTDESEGENKTLSFDELLEANKNYQSEFDKKISKSLETAKVKWEKEQQEKITEAQKLAQMNEKERAKHEQEQKLKAIEDREKALTRKELKYTAIDMLIAEKLPNTFADIVDLSDAESVKNSISIIKKEFDLAVENMVKEKLKGSTPKAGEVETNASKTLADALASHFKLN